MAESILEELGELTEETWMPKPLGRDIRTKELEEFCKADLTLRVYQQLAMALRRDNNLALQQLRFRC